MSPQEDLIVGDPFFKVVNLLPGEEVLDTTLCANQPRSRWRDGQLYLTNQRLIWTPLAILVDPGWVEWILIVLARRTSTLLRRAPLIPICLTRADVTRVFSDSHPIHKSEPRTLEVATRDAAYLFGFNANDEGSQLVEHWASMIKQWTNI
jgi:hypothetical protein